METKRTTALAGPIEEAVARRLHQKRVSRMIDEGYVLGEGGGRTSPLLRPWEDLGAGDRRRLTDKAALGILELGKIGCQVGRAAEDEPMDAYLMDVLATDLARKRYGDVHGGADGDASFDTADPAERERLVAEARELLSAVEDAGVGVRNDGRTEDVRRMELYFEWAKDVTGAADAAGLAVNYGLSRGASFDDVNVFIDAVNRNEGCSIGHYVPEDVAAREYAVAADAYALNFRTEALRVGTSAESSQVTFATFLENEPEAVRSAEEVMASRIAEIGNGRVRSLVTEKAVGNAEALRREMERRILGYDLGVKAAFDRFVVAEQRYAVFTEASAVYAAAPALRRLFMRQPQDGGAAAERGEAKGNLEAVLADRIAVDGNKSLRRIDFGDGTSVKTSVRAIGSRGVVPTVELELTIYDGNVAWHQGRAISADGTARDIPIEPRFREITVEQRYLADDRRPEMIQAQHRFDQVAGMVLRAAMGPRRLLQEPAVTASMDPESFRRRVEEEAGRLREERLRGGDILDEVLGRDPRTGEAVDFVHLIDELVEDEGDHPIYTHLPGEITPRDYDMLIAYGFSGKDIRRLGVEKRATVNADIFDREKQPWDARDPNPRSVYVNLTLTPDSRILVSDPIGGRTLGEAWKVLSSGQSLNFLQIHKDAEMGRPRGQADDMKPSLTLK